jgi:hypothetical protein
MADNAPDKISFGIGQGYKRNVVALLGIEVLLGATVNVANADARVVVIAQ